MIPTLNKISYTAYNTVRGRGFSNDNVSIEQVKFLAKSLRAQLIKQDSNKEYTTDPFIIQNLGCVELEPVDKSICCEVNTNCVILRTKLSIPSTIELHHKQLLTRVGPVDITQPSFGFITYERIPYLGYNRFTKNIIYAFMMNDDAHIYFICPREQERLLTFVNVQGVFEDPEDAAKFSTCNGNACYNDDMEFPIKAWMVPVLMEMIIKSFIGPQALQPNDNTNNAKTDIESPLNQEGQ